ncbi:MAG: hypothetical protein PHI71_14440, partial [Acidiphilium sp.]|nr:hypothetical protein [Acidiphilium sp.]
MGGAVEVKDAADRGWLGRGVSARGRGFDRSDGLGDGRGGGDGGCGTWIVQPAGIVRARCGGARAAGFRGCGIGGVPVFAGWRERVG